MADILPEVSNALTNTAKSSALLDTIEDEICPSNELQNLKDSVMSNGKILDDKSTDIKICNIGDEKPEPLVNNCSKSDKHLTNGNGDTQDLSNSCGDTISSMITAKSDLVVKSSITDDPEKVLANDDALGIDNIAEKNYSPNSPSKSPVDGKSPNTESNEPEKSVTDGNTNLSCVSDDNDEIKSLTKGENEEKDSKVVASHQTELTDKGISVTDKNDDSTLVVLDSKDDGNGDISNDKLSKSITVVEQNNDDVAVEQLNDSTPSSLKPSEIKDDNALEDDSVLSLDLDGDITSGKPIVESNDLLVTNTDISKPVDIPNETPKLIVTLDSSNEDKDHIESEKQEIKIDISESTEICDEDKELIIDDFSTNKDNSKNESGEGSTLVDKESDKASSLIDNSVSTKNNISKEENVQKDSKISTNESINICDEDSELVEKSTSTNNDISMIEKENIPIITDESIQICDEDSELEDSTSTSNAISMVEKEKVPTSTEESTTISDEESKLKEDLPSTNTDISEIETSEQVENEVTISKLVEPNKCVDKEEDINKVSASGVTLELMDQSLDSDGNDGIELMDTDDADQPSLAEGTETKVQEKENIAESDPDSCGLNKPIEDNKNLVVVCSSNEVEMIPEADLSNPQVSKLGEMKLISTGDSIDLVNSKASKDVSTALNMKDDKLNIGMSNGLTETSSIKEKEEIKINGLPNNPIDSSNKENNTEPKEKTKTATSVPLDCSDIDLDDSSKSDEILLIDDDDDDILEDCTPKPVNEQLKDSKSETVKPKDDLEKDIQKSNIETKVLPENVKKRSISPDDSQDLDAKRPKVDTVIAEEGQQLEVDLIKTEDAKHSKVDPVKTEDVKQSKVDPIKPEDAKLSIDDPIKIEGTKYSKVEQVKTGDAKRPTMDPIKPEDAKRPKLDHSKVESVKPNVDQVKNGDTSSTSKASSSKEDDSSEDVVIEKIEKGKHPATINALCITSEILQGFVRGCVRTYMKRRKQESLEKLHKQNKGMQSASTMWKETAKHLEKSLDDLNNQTQGLEKKWMLKKSFPGRTVGVQVHIGDSVQRVERVAPAQLERSPQSKQRGASSSLGPSVLLNPGYNTQSVPRSPVNITPQPRAGRQLGSGNQGQPRHQGPRQMQPMNIPQQRSPANHLQNGNRMPAPQPAPVSSHRNSVNLIDLTDEDDKPTTQPQPSRRSPKAPQQVQPKPPPMNNMQQQNPQMHQRLQNNNVLQNSSQQQNQIVQQNGVPVQFMSVQSPTGLRPGAAMFALVPRPQTQAPGQPITQLSPLPQQPNKSRHSLPPSVHIEQPTLKHPAPPPPPPSVANIPALAKKLPPKPGLKISRVTQGIVLSWNMPPLNEVEDIASYQLFAYQEAESAVPSTSLWKKVGDVKALPLPMACTLTQFQEGNKYHFTVRAVDKFDRCGSYSDPSAIFLGKRD